MKLSRKQRRTLYKQHKAQPSGFVLSSTDVAKLCLKMLFEMGEVNRIYEKKAQSY